MKVNLDGSTVEIAIDSLLTATSGYVIIGAR